MRGLNEIFRKDVTYNNIKSHKKQGFILFSQDTFLEKPQEGSQIGAPTPPSAVLGLNINNARGTRHV